LDSSKNAYIAGSTSSSDFPVTTGAFQTTNKAFANNGSNAFIAKFNATGTALLYSTFMGVSTSDSALGIALDGSGNVYVAGTSLSSDFPVTAGAFQTTIPMEAAFVAKLNTTGTALVYSTFLGGSNTSGSVFNDANGIAVDDSGNAYVADVTPSTNFPVTADAFQTTNKEGSKGAAFLTKFNATGSALLYSTYLSGSNGLYG
jgi:Beta-propeller repeat